MMLRYEPNGEVHCKLFYNAKLLIEGIFSKWREAGWPINTLCFELVKEGVINFTFLVEESKREGICIKWWDEQVYNNTRLISLNKYVEYYLLKRN